MAALLDRQSVFPGGHAVVVGGVTTAIRSNLRTIFEPTRGHVCYPNRDQAKIKRTWYEGGAEGA